MPRKTPADARLAIEQAARYEPDATAAEVRRKIIRMIDAGKFPGPAPAERTVAEIVRAARAAPPPDIDSEPVLWPEAFGDRAAFPAAAAAPYFELCRELDGRPTVRLFRRFLEVTAAAPKAPVRDRRWMAADLAFWEVMPSRSHTMARRTLEAYILREHWKRGTYLPSVPATPEGYGRFSDEQAAIIREIKYGALTVEQADVGPVREWLAAIIEQQQGPTRDEIDRKWEQQQRREMHDAQGE